MSPAGVTSAWGPPLWLGLWGRLRCAPTPSHTCSQPIPSVHRPSFTFSVLVTVSSLADLGYLSRPPLPFTVLSLSKGLSTSLLVSFFPQQPSWSSLLVYICTVSRSLCIVTVPSFWIIPIFVNARTHDSIVPVDPHISRHLHHLEVVVQSLPETSFHCYTAYNHTLHSPPNITPPHLGTKVSTKDPTHLCSTSI